jgi:hypothetical protein
LAGKITRVDLFERPVDLAPRRLVEPDESEAPADRGAGERFRVLPRFFGGPRLTVSARLERWTTRTVEAKCRHAQGAGTATHETKTAAAA